MRFFYLQITIFFLCLKVVCIYAQPNTPQASPSVKTFALNPDKTGAGINTLNLFTGDVNYPVNLVSLPGKNGLNASVSISYSSNVQSQVDTWNLESPTGVLGLGWSFDMPKIVVDHKQTGARDDDEFSAVVGA